MKKFALSGAFLTNMDKKEESDMMTKLLASLLKQNSGEENRAFQKTETDGGNADKKDILSQLYPQYGEQNGERQESKDEKLSGHIDYGKDVGARSTSVKTPSQDDQKGGSDYYAPPPDYGLH